MRRSQGGPRLLRQVEGRQHATAEDHADETPKSPRRDLALGINTDNEDFDREPDSSEDESVNGTDAHFKRANLSYIAHASSQSNPARRISPSSNHVIKLGNKRASPHEHDNDDHDDDAIFESSQGSEKRRKLGGAIPAFVNALAPQRDARRRKALPQKYGRTSNKFAVDKQPEKKSFKKPGSGTALTEKPVKVASFQKLQSRIKGGREESGAAEGKEDGQTDDEMLRNDIRDIETEQDSLRCQCPICGKPVGILVREEFEDEHRHQFRGRRMNFQWQKRFCLHHQVLAARETWQERRYPQIDWSTLDSKMQKHEAFLLQVVRDTTHSRSYYREELRTRLQPGSRSMKQSFHASRPGASVGYYGPRGERVMTDYILNNLSDRIRNQAAHDELVAASGVQGGVSGFVQAVLVPHLAEQLIADDMNLSRYDEGWCNRARVIIAESAEAGELLHPEVEDRIVLDEDEVVDE